MKEIKLKGLNETIYEDVCNNGLKVYFWVKKDVSSFYATISIKYGSIYNEYKVNNKKYNKPKGIAHFLEHIKFNESEALTAHDYFNKNGCDTNAFTTFNYTNYQVYGSDNIVKNVLHLLDFVEKPYFTNKIINDEKGIIIEEANMGYDDPYTVMLFKHLENIFYNYEHQYLITGCKDDIKRISLDDINDVFKAFYHPENMFLVVTGNFNPHELMNKIKEHESQKNYDQYLNPKRIIKKEIKRVKKKYEEIRINVTNEKVRIGIKIPKKSLNEYDDLTIRLLLQILMKANFGNTSDFKDELLTKELISNISYFQEIFDNYIVVFITIDTNCNSEIIELFNNKLDNLTIDKNTFERMKKAYIASLILEYEDVEVVNSIIQSEILNYGSVIQNIKDIYENIKYNDIKKFVTKLNLKERSVLLVKPIDDNKKE